MQDRYGTGRRHPEYRTDLPTKRGRSVKVSVTSFDKAVVLRIGPIRGTAGKRVQHSHHARGRHLEDCPGIRGAAERVHSIEIPILRLNETVVWIISLFQKRRERVEDGEYAAG